MARLAPPGSAVQCSAVQVPILPQTLDAGHLDLTEVPAGLVGEAALHTLPVLPLLCPLTSSPREGGGCLSVRWVYTHTSRLGREGNGRCEEWHRASLPRNLDCFFWFCFLPGLC